MTQRQEEKEPNRFRKKAAQLLELSKWSAKRMLMPKKRRRALDIAFINAARAGNNNEVKRLLKAGADMAAEYNLGRTALHFAAAMGQTKTCALLIEQCAKLGGDVNKFIAVKDASGRTPLRIATSQANKQTAEFLKSIECFMGITNGKFNSFLASFSDCIGN